MCNSYSQTSHNAVALHISNMLWVPGSPYLLKEWTSDVEVGWSQMSGGKDFDKGKKLNLVLLQCNGIFIDQSILVGESMHQKL